ncbi:PREDICTED: circulating cathodic antigen homolog [Drosophila arizonae]|uniref:Circulating cathodic antigen homolog n=1 Tax=Drosophila arizonae TaxID=7263 RepID=A0ABM1NTU0_DROAR|nr:PREDICTED: circulating cathodic antigen homolog [Drosophila arizonae]XP_017858376.1 PREDICTED: circulating cathodic antigen homolog [Drosophila arizonae]
MSNLSVGQMIMDAQRMASRVKDLDALGTALLEEAETNNRLVESLRQYQEDIESLNRVANNKTNADMVNRIQQQNVNSSEILKENRELKICIEDYERAMELMMQKYREHTVTKVLDNKLNFKELYNERLWQVIREQREKINEMAAVMHRAATADDENVQRELQTISQLRMENETLRELLQISKKYGSAQRPIREGDHLLEEKAVQTDNQADDSADDLSISGASVENMNNNSVIQMYSSPEVITSASNASNNSAITASVNALSAAQLTNAVGETIDAAVAVAAATGGNTAEHTNANENNNGPAVHDTPETPAKPTAGMAAAATIAAAPTATSAASTSTTTPNDVEEEHTLPVVGGAVVVVGANAT